MLVSGYWIKEEYIYIYPEFRIKHPASARLKQSDIYAYNTT